MVMFGSNRAGSSWPGLDLGGSSDTSDGPTKLSKNRAGCRVRVLGIAAAVVVLAGISVQGVLPIAVASQETMVLDVGVRHEMATLNPLAANDPWTWHVLDRVYDRPLQVLPNGSLLRYIAKGVDFDEDGVFETTEVGTFAERRPAETPLDVTVYYDFNGVVWHDGSAMDVWDLLFSYHVGAMNPWSNASLTVLFAGPNATYDGPRQLNVTMMAKDWQGEASMAGDPDRRVALRFRLNEPYVEFFDHTLAPLLLPLHVWSGAGGGRHADFGCAIFVPPAVASTRGVPCGTTDPGPVGRGVPSDASSVTPYRFAEAGGWEPSDADVIGSGPFRFVSWLQSEWTALARNDQYYVGSPSDPDLGRTLSRPKIDGVSFRFIGNDQIRVFALQTGEVDLLISPVPPEFSGPLRTDENVALVVHPDLGYAYLGYNLRRPPFGYEAGDPHRDPGYRLRTAIAHAVDKRTAVASLLQDLGTVAHGYISPASAFWHDDTVPPRPFSLETASAILDSADARAAGIGEDPPGACQSNGTGCRSLPGVGTTQLAILELTTGEVTIPERRTLGQFVATGLHSLGINARVQWMSRWFMEEAIATREFDMFLWTADVQRPDPSEHFVASFHSSGVAAGANHVGFVDALFDRLVEMARMELDRETRRYLVWQAHDILLDQRPAEPLYYVAHLEAYRQDRFANWTSMDGTILNYWSLLGIRPSASRDNPILTAMEYPSTVVSGSPTYLSLKTFDRDRTEIPGVTVTFAVDLGALVLRSESGRSVTGTTDSDGSFTVWFVAPEVDQVTLVTITVTASHSDFWPAVSQGAIYVFPVGVRFLSVRSEQPFGGAVVSGAILPIRIFVHDQGGTEVDDAIVRVSTSDLSKLAARPAEGPSFEMIDVILEAARGIEQEARVDVTIEASRDGHASAQQTISILVLPSVGESASSGIPAEVLVAGVLVPAAIAIIAALVLLRRRR